MLNQLFNELGMGGVILSAVLVSVVAALVMKLQKKDLSLEKILVFLFLGGYIGGLMQVFIFPLTMIGTYEKYQYIRINLVPMKEILNGFHAENYLEIIVNLFIFMPLPFLLYYFNRSIKQTMKYGSLGIFLIEPLQFLLNFIAKAPLHVADIDDFILNMMGFLMAGACLKIIQQRRSDTNLVLKNESFGR